MGYPVSHNTADLSSHGSHPWFILSVRFSRTIGTLLEFGSSGNDEVNNASALIATVLYYPQFRSSHWLKPYIGAGIGICSYSPNQSFYYGNRVSPIDPTNGSYKYLASVNFVGGESNACVSLQGGIAVEQESKLTRLSFQVYATCVLAPAFEIRASGGESSTVRFGKVQLGGRLLIYL
jgi:hypothetical protein